MDDLNLELESRTMEDHHNEPQFDEWHGNEVLNTRRQFQRTSLSPDGCRARLDSIDEEPLQDGAQMLAGPEELQDTNDTHSGNVQRGYWRSSNFLSNDDQWRSLGQLWRREQERHWQWLQQLQESQWRWVQQQWQELRQEWSQWRQQQLRQEQQHVQRQQRLEQWERQLEQGERQLEQRQQRLEQWERQLDQRKQQWQQQVQWQRRKLLEERHQLQRQQQWQQYREPGQQWLRHQQNGEQQWQPNEQNEQQQWQRNQQHDEQQWQQNQQNEQQQGHLQQRQWLLELQETQQHAEQQHLAEKALGEDGNSVGDVLVPASTLAEPECPVDTSTSASCAFLQTPSDRRECRRSVQRDSSSSQALAQSECEPVPPALPCSRESDVGAEHTATQKELDGENAQLVEVKPSRFALQGQARLLEQQQQQQEQQQQHHQQYCCAAPGGDGRGTSVGEAVVPLSSAAECEPCPSSLTPSGEVRECRRRYESGVASSQVLAKSRVGPMRPAVPCTRECVPTDVGMEHAATQEETDVKDPQLVTFVTNVCALRGQAPQLEKRQHIQQHLRQEAPGEDAPGSDSGEAIVPVLRAAAHSPVATAPEPCATRLMSAEVIRARERLRRTETGIASAKVPAQGRVEPVPPATPCNQERVLTDIGMGQTPPQEETGVRNPLIVAGQPSSFMLQQQVLQIEKGQHDGHGDGVGEAAVPVLQDTGRVDASASEPCASLLTPPDVPRARERPRERDPGVASAKEGRDVKVFRLFKVPPSAVLIRDQVSRPAHPDGSVTVAVRSRVAKTKGSGVPCAPKPNPEMKPSALMPFSTVPERSPVGPPAPLPAASMTTSTKPTALTRTVLMPTPPTTVPKPTAARPCAPLRTVLMPAGIRLSAPLRTLPKPLRIVLEPSATKPSVLLLTVPKPHAVTSVAPVASLSRTSTATDKPGMPAASCITTTPSDGELAAPRPDKTHIFKVFPPGEASAPTFPAATPQHPSVQPATVPFAVKPALPASKPGAAMPLIRGAARQAGDRIKVVEFHVISGVRGKQKTPCLRAQSPKRDGSSSVEPHPKRIKLVAAGDGRATAEPTP